MVDFCFLFSESSSTLYDQYLTNIPEKSYFPNVGGTIFTCQAIFEGGIREPLRFARSNFLRFIKKWKNEDTGQKRSPGRHREFRILWNPPIRLKKMTGNASPHNSTGRTSFRILRKRNFDRYSWFSAQWSILSWFWPDFAMRFGWPSVTCLILV